MLLRLGVYKRSEGWHHIPENKEIWRIKAGPMSRIGQLDIEGLLKKKGIIFIPLSDTGRSSWLEKNY